MRRMLSVPGSWASAPGVRRSMRGNRARDTKPEVRIRQALHARGLRFRVDLRLQPPLRTRADIVFTRARVAVFVDGCFWHSCPIHGTAPRTNSAYWLPKLERNRQRDLETTRALQAAGWMVVRVWEHEEVAAVADLVEGMVRGSR